jgi:hypothetical protein
MQKPLIGVARAVLNIYIQISLRGFYDKKRIFLFVPIGKRERYLSLRRQQTFTSR